MPSARAGSVGLLAAALVMLAAITGLRSLAPTESVLPALRIPVAAAEQAQRDQARPADRPVDKQFSWNRGAPAAATARPGRTLPAVPLLAALAGLLGLATAARRRGASGDPTASLGRPIVIRTSRAPPVTVWVLPLPTP